MNIDEEELQIWKRYRKHRRAEDRDILLSRYLHLAAVGAARHMQQYGVASQAARLYIDDVNGWAMDGLLQSIERYDPKQNANFAAYARLRIRGNIIDNLRTVSGNRNKNKIEVAYFSDMEIVSRSADSTICDYLPSPAAGSWTDEEYRDCAVEIAKGAELTERQTIILTLRLRGYTQEEIAARIGLSEARISQILTKEVLPLCREFYLRRGMAPVMGA